MAAGVPVLCSNVTSIPEVAGDSPLLFDPRKPDEIAAAISRVAGDPELVSRVTDEGRRRAAAFGGPREMALAYWKVFQEVAAAPPCYPNGVHGIYVDGWFSERVILTYAEGATPRKAVLELVAPPWITADAMTLTLLPGSANAQSSHGIERGRSHRIEIPLPSTSGYIEMACEPTFRPVDCGLGEDTRPLGFKLDSIRIVSPDAAIDLLDASKNGL